MSIQVSGLCFAYDKAKILNNLSFETVDGEMVFLLGPNGAGKTTLFRCLLGQLRPSAGEITIAGRPLSSYSPSALAKRVAYIPQSEAPVYNYSVLQMAVMGRTTHLSALASPSRSDYLLTMDMLDKLGIAHLAHRGIQEISGGEHQLMLIARALVQQADILVMDEPASSLDYGNQLRIQMQLKDLSREGRLILQSSHNPQHAMLFADKVIALLGGNVISFGMPGDVITEDLLQKLYNIHVSIKDGMLIPDLQKVSS
ncbi:MAG: ABC transporter ATP-binding protein [Saccharofermentanales bacterium]